MSWTGPLTVQMRVEEDGDAAAGVHGGQFVVADGPDAQQFQQKGSVLVHEAVAGVVTEH